MEFLRAIEKRPMSCDKCRRWAEKKGIVPACDSCLPDLLPENYPIYQVWQLVSGQWIVAGMGDPIAINHLAIWELLDRYGEELGVENKLECFLLINRCFGILMSERREKHKLEHGSSGGVVKKARRH